MRRIAAFLSFFALPVFLSILFMPRAAACQDDPPPDLRELYLTSDVIVVGKIGVPQKWTLSAETTGPDSRYRTYTRTIPIRVEDAIKGGSMNVAAVSESEAVMIGNEENEQARRQYMESEYYSSLAQNKERRIFFLQKEGEAYFEASYGTDLEFTQKQLEVFIPRLRELDNIANAREPAKARLVEWLVGMAENPVTRSEGAAEIGAMLEEALMDEGAKEAAEEEDDTEEGYEEDEDEADEYVEEADAEPEPEENILDIEAYDGYLELSRLLTADQKERIVRAAVGLRFNYKLVKYDEDDEDEEGHLQILSEADDALLDAASFLRDRRVADRLLTELPAVSRADPGEAAKLIVMLSRYYDDEKLDALMEKYEAVSAGEDDEFITDAGVAYDEPVKNTLRRAPQPQKTYGHRRAELLQQVLKLCRGLRGKR